MNTPERIWAWWEHDSDFRITHRWEDEARTFSDDEYDGGEYIHADTIAEMIRQAVADASGLHLIIAAIREATVGGKPMLSDLPAALLEWRQAAVQAEREACARMFGPVVAAAIRARGET